jgi:hypothetical protein
MGEGGVGARHPTCLPLLWRKQHAPANLTLWRLTARGPSVPSCQPWGFDLREGAVINIAALVRLFHITEGLARRRREQGARADDDETDDHSPQHAKTLTRAECVRGERTQLRGLRTLRSHPARYEECVSVCARARRRGQRAAQPAAAPPRDQLSFDPFATNYRTLLAAQYTDAN